MSDPAPSPISLLSRYRAGVLFLGVTLVILLIQSLTGVWTSDIGADPDEPAHAVTGLMVRDYLATGLGQSPLTFAQEYYEAFPKVALGHYPPGYYALAGLVLLPWPQPPVLLMLQAVFTGLLALQVYLTGRRFLRDSSAMAAAILSAAFPVTLKLTQLVMADLMLACLCLLAVEFWVRFLEKPSYRWALLFGGTAAAAILTKGSGLALALVPAVTVLVMRRWELLKKPAFWAAGLPVGLLAGPWMLYSSKITKEGMVSAGLVDFALGAVTYYGSVLSTSFGFVTVMMAVPGLALWLELTKFKLRPDARRTALLGLLLGTVLIMLFIPTGYSSRYFMPVVPVVALLAVSFFDFTLSKTPVGRFGIICLVLLVVFQVPYLLVKNVHGFRSAVMQALEKPTTGELTHWLVCADPRGEGALIASAAFALRSRSPSLLHVHRASKELAATDWLGRDYKPTFDSPEALLAYLDKTNISRVFVHVTAEGESPSAHEELLLNALRGQPDRWTLESSGAITRPYQLAPGPLEVYARKP